jgi:MGT family glycosyltransferase
MARFLFAPIPFTGHVNPGLPIAQELVRRGHEVRWYTTPRFQKAVEKVGAVYVPFRNGRVMDEEKLDEQFPDRAQLKGLDQLRYDMKNAFIDPVHGFYQDLMEEFEAEPFDVVIGDSCAAVGWLLQERLALPWAVYGISVLGLSSQDTAPFGLGIMPNDSAMGRLRNRMLHWAVRNVVFKETHAQSQAMRKALGFEPSSRFLFDFGLDADLYLQNSVPSFEYPMSDLPDHVKFVGSVVPEPPAEWTRPSWWSELESGKKVVLVTQGTIANDYDELIRPAIRALANEDVLVVVTTGSKPAEAVGIDPLPENVRVERFVPYAHLMPKVNLLLTNGGYGSVQIALSHGVPVVAFGASEDKPEIANRVQWSGVGIGVKSKTPTEAQIKEAVSNVLYDPMFRGRALKMSRELAQHDAPRQSAELLEGLVPARAPQAAMLV